MRRYASAVDQPIGRDKQKHHQSDSRYEKGYGGSQGEVQRGLEESMTFEEAPDQEGAREIDPPPLILCLARRTLGNSSPDDEPPGEQHRGQRKRSVEQDRLIHRSLRGEQRQGHTGKE